MLSLSACTNGNNEPEEEPPSSTTSATADSKETAARKAAEQAYMGMREEQAKAYAKPDDYDEKALSRYAADQALAKMESELFKYRSAGVYFRGKPASTVDVKAVDINGSPKKATVEECLDISDWKAVEKKTGKDVTATGQQPRYIVNGSVRTIGDRWVVVKVDVDKGRKC